MTEKRDSSFYNPSEDKNDNDIIPPSDLTALEAERLSTLHPSKGHYLSSLKNPDEKRVLQSLEKKGYLEYSPGKNKHYRVSPEHQKIISSLQSEEKKAKSLLIKKEEKKKALDLKRRREKSFAILIDSLFQKFSNTSFFASDAWFYAESRAGSVSRKKILEALEYALQENWLIFDPVTKKYSFPYPREQLFDSKKVGGEPFKPNNPQ